MKSADKIKASLLKKYKYKTELHAHTLPASGCSEVSPEELVEIYHAEGIDALVVANHFTYSKSQEYTKEEFLQMFLKDFEETKAAGKKYGIKVILAAEIRFSENNNDYLVYGVDREILSKCYDYLSEGIEVFRREVKLSDSLFVQAHPFRNGMEKCNPDLLDGIETFNMHPNHNSRVGLAVKYAQQNNLTVTTVGSDFHHPDRKHEAVGILRTKVLPKDSFHLAKLLKSGDYIFEIGKNAIVLP